MNTLTHNHLLIYAQKQMISQAVQIYSFLAKINVKQSHILKKEKSFVSFKIASNFCSIQLQFSLPWKNLHDTYEPE